MFQYRCIAIGVLRLIFDNPAIRRLVMTLTKEENRVYSLYTCGIGGGFRSQDWCYETLNERRTTKDSRSSQKGHYYKIKW